MTKSLPLILVLALSLLLIYFFGSHLFSLIGWIISHLFSFISWVTASSFDIVLWAITNAVQFCISIAWVVLKTSFLLVVEIYKTLFLNYPVIFISCYLVVFAIGWLFSLRLNYLWIFSLIPVIATIIGGTVYGNWSLHIDVTFSDAGLLACSVLVIFGFYYALIKSGVIKRTTNGENVVSKILNHSFVVVLVLMLGAFGLAMVDKIGPLLKA